MLRRLAVFVLLLFIVPLAWGESAIPTPAQYLGYPLGERFTPWDRILGYFDELAKQSKLITVEKIGETYEGRPLVIAVITSEKNRANLDAIRHDVAALANGEPDASRAAAIAKSSPSIVWLAFGVHGNETSSSEAAMQIAANLVRDPASRALLDDLVVIIDPLQNPDGRERYVQWFTRTRGAEPNPNPDAFEHAEPWPGGRTNHYLVDMNRDWAWTSQKETQARVAQYRVWNPQVFVDFHEMGANSTYFFPPDAKPINANLPREVVKWLTVFGRANADAFTKRGWPFFVAERFDLFYPAYGDSWPSLHGAIGMTYEVAGGGRSGSLCLREDGTLLRLSHRIEEHTTSGMATLQTAAAHREDLLRYIYDAARAQMQNGRNTYLVPPGSPNFQPMVALLQRQGITLGQLTSPLTTRATAVGGAAAESRTFPAGTLVVSTRQPLGRLAETLLEKSPTFDAGFLEEQRSKTEADEPDDFYDLTSWSLPLAMNVPSWVVNTPFSGGVAPYAAAATPAFHAAGYGYVVDAFEPNLYRAVGAMLTDGVNFNVSEDELAFDGRTFARGSIVVLRGNNKPDLDATLQRIADEQHVAIVPVESGWTGGTALGSERIHYVRDPKIALVGGNGVSPYSYGMLWHTLDVDTPVPYTAVALDSLRNIDLSRYRVLILPDGEAYADRLGKKGIEKLRNWLRDGGTVVAVKGAAKFLRDKDVEISKLSPWEPPKKKDEETSPAPRDERYNEFRVPGSTFRTSMNARSFLTFGVQKSPAVLVEGTAAYLPVAHKVDNIVTIDAQDPLISGVAWPESLERMRGSVYMVDEPFGKGNVITFADEPYFRSFWRGTLPLFMNSVLYAPSFPRGTP